MITKDFRRLVLHYQTVPLIRQAKNVSLRMFRMTLGMWGPATQNIIHI